MENAKPECSPILELSLKQGTESGKEYKILKKRERYTEGSVERLGNSHNLRTILEWGIAHCG